MKTLPSRNIPAIANLIVFQLCAQHLSFTKVGQKIGLSQGAVSRQVIELEEYLRKPLFVREQRSLQLTPAGVIYAAAIEPLLRGLEDATNVLRMQNETAGLLRVSVSISVCYRWLVPRMPDLTRKHPELTIDLNPAFGYDIHQKAKTDDYDVSILIYDAPPPAAANAQLLLPLDCYAVCAPSLHKSDNVLSMQALLELPLLHQKELPQFWQSFVDDAGFGHLCAPAGMLNDSGLMSVQSAVAGLGVALLPKFIIEEELAGGQLVLAHSHKFQTKYGYYMTYNEARRKCPLLAHFCEWVVHQAADSLRLAG